MNEEITHVSLYRCSLL